MAEVLNGTMSFYLAIKWENKKDWLEAVNCKMCALVKNQNWNPVPRKIDTNLSTTKWVFRKRAISWKCLLQTNFKARLTTRGFQQVHSIVFEETFEAAVKFLFLRLKLAILAPEGLALHQMNLKTAFLKCDMSENIYMKQPKGFLTNKSKHAFVDWKKRSMV